MSESINIEEIVQYLKEALLSDKIPFECKTTVSNTSDVLIRYIVVLEGNIFVFECTPFYVQLKMNDSIFQWGDHIQNIDIRIVYHYAMAFLRLIQTYIFVSEFNEESKTASIDIQLCVQNFLQYNIPRIHLDLFLKKEEIGCVLIRHLISEHYWIPPSNEGYPLSDNPISGDSFYYQSLSKGLIHISLENFHSSCHQLVGKMIQ